MENYGAGVEEELPSPQVHVRMCLELLNLIDVVSKIIPEIEAARPHASGMEALCSLVSAISKAKSLLQRCSESSILYLAFTGDGILYRCKKTRNILEHSLSRIQTMVPVMLSAKISGIIFALRRAAFCLDLQEEEAGKVLREILHKYGSKIDSSEDFALSAIHTVCSHLHISSQKALVIEQRSLKRQLDKVGEGERSKRKILRLFLSLLNKYKKVMTEEGMDNDSTAHEYPLPFAGPHNLSWEDSSDSILSLSSISLGSSQDSDPSYTNIVNSVDPSREICALPLDSSCSAVEKVRTLLKISDESWSMMPFGKIIQLLVRFLKDARDNRDVEAQMSGCLYLLQLVQKHSKSRLYMDEDAYSLLASFLDTEVAKQALSILDVLSFHQHCGYKIAASGALVGILNILESQVQELLEPALNILSNLCSNSHIRAYIAETYGCITSIAKLLENGRPYVEQMQINLDGKSNATGESSASNAIVDSTI